MTSSTLPRATNLVAVAEQAGGFTTLLAALQAARLTDTLAGPGSFTVFAPGDAAFAQLPAGALDRLLQDRAALRDVLLYHVVPGRLLAADVAKLTTATTLQGNDVAIDVSDGVRVGDATVVQADIPAENGVIHVIDRVLFPH